MKEDTDKPSELTHLPVDDAQRVLNEMWKVYTISSYTSDSVCSLPPQILEQPVVPHAKSSSLQSLSAHKKLRRLSLKVALEYDRLPLALFLTGVTCLDNQGIGQGSFADVYRGDYAGKAVAIKRLKPYSDPLDPEQMKNRRAFCRETLLWKNLSHKHILPFFGVSNNIFKSKNSPLCMVLPWMENGNLRQHIRSLQKDDGLAGQRLTEALEEWVSMLPCRRVHLIF